MEASGEALIVGVEVITTEAGEDLTEAMTETTAGVLLEVAEAEEHGGMRLLILPAVAEATTAVTTTEDTTMEASGMTTGMTTAARTLAITGPEALEAVP